MLCKHDDKVVGVIWKQPSPPPTVWWRNFHLHNKDFCPYAELSSRSRTWSQKGCIPVQIKHYLIIKLCLDVFLYSSDCYVYDFRVEHWDARHPTHLQPGSAALSSIKEKALKKPFCLFMLYISDYAILHGFIQRKITRFV